MNEWEIAGIVIGGIIVLFCYSLYQNKQHVTAGRCGG
jgi:hypothetical protein